MLLPITINNLVGIGSIAGGTIIGTLGFKCVDIIMSFFGSILGALLVYWTSLEYPFPVAVHVITSFMFSVVLSFICMRYKSVPCAIIGLITAAWMSNAFLGVMPQTNVMQFIIACLFIFFPVVFGLSPFICVMSTSSFYGSWFIVSGIDKFMDVGFPSIMSMLLDHQWATRIKCGSSSFLLSLLLASLTMLSFTLQYYTVNSLNLRENWDRDPLEVCVVSSSNNSDNDNSESKGLLDDAEDDEDEMDGETPYSDPTNNIDRSYLYKEKKIVEETVP
ncbi:hypothetical protein SAMD00019534_017830, partial [Acytostelium subglobosum LB1]|uniref:hypothetical protein n=1 Tax=Acytostelium subglobosum LB1 TaxID=1410327 RepID=UPI000644CEBB